MRKKRSYEICQFDDLFRFRKDQIVNDNLILEFIKIKDSNGKNRDRGYLCKCIYDGYVRPLEQYKFDKGLHSCAVCDNKVVVKGINDVATTQPELVQYIHDKSIIHSITKRSERQIELECPICHTIKIGKLKDLAKYGFSCPKCGDGRTIPNKLMYLILEQGGLDFECEVNFEWCSFPLFNRKDKFTHGIYDFVVRSKNLIIEMDGGLGHGKKLHSRSKKTLEETLYRDRMKDKLASEHGYKVIRIDCDYTEDNKYEYMFKSLMDSDLSNYIDIANINLKELFIEANNTSLVKDAADLWNEGLSRGEISEKLKFGKATIRKYLKIGTDLGLCNYNGEDSYERGIDAYSIGDYEYSLHFKSARDFSDFLEMYNIPLNFHTIKNRFVSEKVDETIINDILIKREKHNQ